MSIKEMEAALETTRQKIVEQEGLIIESRVTGNELSGLVQSIDPSLYRQERELERLLKHLQAVSDAPTRSQKLLLVNEFENKRNEEQAVTLQDLLTEYKD